MATLIELNSSQFFHQKTKSESEINPCSNRVRRVSLQATGIRGVTAAFRQWNRSFLQVKPQLF